MHRVRRSQLIGQVGHAEPRPQVSKSLLASRSLLSLIRTSGKFHKLGFTDLQVIAQKCESRVAIDSQNRSLNIRHRCFLSPTSPPVQSRTPGTTPGTSPPRTPSAPALAATAATAQDLAPSQALRHALG